jgi:hypothetical protein
MKAVYLWPSSTAVTVHGDITAQFSQDLTPRTHLPVHVGQRGDVEAVQLYCSRGDRRHRGGHFRVQHRQLSEHLFGITKRQKGKVNSDETTR